MRTLADASLTPSERKVLGRLVDLLGEEFGDDLHGIWLYGSRARGEQAGPDSDVDLLVVGRRGGADEVSRLTELVFEAAGSAAEAPRFSALLYTPERVAQRREIRSFFIQEVDRDKIVLAGAP